MAASKDTRPSTPDTNPFFLKLFRNSSVSEKRERVWHDAVRHAGTGDPRLRFPVYEHLYLLNVYAQKVVELPEELRHKFAINKESLPYFQYVRASATHGLVGFMNGVEETEAWLHQSQQRAEEEKLSDPDDVYISVRQREAERLRQRLPPCIQFLNEPRTVKTPTTKKRRAGKANRLYSSPVELCFSQRRLGRRRACPQGMTSTRKNCRLSLKNCLRSVRANSVSPGRLQESVCGPDRALSDG